MDRTIAYQTIVDGVPDAVGTASLADRVYRQVLRHDFDEPGFALVSLGPAVGSKDLRRFMVALKQALADRHQQATGHHLVYLSMGRFDQQVSTKFHLDGAPDESVLMLGYEPSEVRSELAMADYSRAAFDLGIEPRRFLDEHNPMFVRGEDCLAPYVTRLDAFDPGSAQVLLINNSALPIAEGSGHTLGVLHRATIPNPDPSMRRVVNSSMMEIARDPKDEPVTQQAQQEFVETAEIAGKSYR